MIPGRSRWGPRSVVDVPRDDHPAPQSPPTGDDLPPHRPPADPTGDAPLLEVERTTTGLRVIGELDLATVPILASHLDPLPEWCDEVVVDLNGLSFVDSTGLSVLLHAHHNAEASGRRIVLTSPSDRVRRLLEITGLGEVLVVRDAGPDGSADGGSSAGRSGTARDERSAEGPAAVSG
jgi:anti-sigma B factor antagonist